MGDRFWDFSQKIYGSPDVEQECLGLQEAFGIDVNILLFCAYAAVSSNVSLSDQDFDEIDRRVAGIRDAAIVPLRACRRGMKEASAGFDRAERDRIESLRHQVQTLELAAERWEQDELVLWFESVSEGRHAFPEALERNIQQLLLRCRKGRGKPQFPLHLAQAARELEGT